MLDIKNKLCTSQIGNNFCYSSFIISLLNEVIILEDESRNLLQSEINKIFNLDKENAQKINPDSNQWHTTGNKKVKLYFLQ